MTTNAELLAQAKAALAVAMTGAEVDVKIGPIEVKGSQKVGQLLEIINTLQRPVSIASVSFGEGTTMFGENR